MPSSEVRIVWKASGSQKCERPPDLPQGVACSRPGEREASLGTRQLLEGVVEERGQAVARQRDPVFRDGERLSLIASRGRRAARDREPPP